MPTSQVVQFVVLFHAECTRIMVEVHHHLEHLRSKVRPPQLLVQLLSLRLGELEVDDVAPDEHQALLE